MVPLEEKCRLIEELRQRLESEYQALRAAQRATVEGATHEEAKPENDKDTRALEQTYLARGQAARVAQLKEDLDVFAQLRPRRFSPDSAVALTALVRLVDENEAAALYLLLPAGAGETLESSLGDVKVVTPGSPLGRALSGARLDDDVELRSPKGKRLLSVAEMG